jgi:uncharacterized protein YcbK (DUF882 family)
MPRALQGTLNVVVMGAEQIKRSAGAFALAWLALCVSLSSGQVRQRRQQARKPATTSTSTKTNTARTRPVADTPSIAEDENPVVRAPLLLMPVNGGSAVELVPRRDDGGFSDADLRRAAVAFSQQSPGKVHPLAPRLLDLVYRCVRHFDASLVRVVSGYRRDRAGSRHTQGRAVDMAIEGVANDRLAAYVREFGFVGVGFYPKAGFVHLDVRDASYFWVDDSAPGAPNHLIPVLEDEARSADASARARGEAPDMYVPNNRAEDAAAAKVYAHRARLRRSAQTSLVGIDSHEHELDAPDEPTVQRRHAERSH